MKAFFKITCTRAHEQTGGQLKIKSHIYGCGIYLCHKKAKDLLNGKCSKPLVEIFVALCYLDIIMVATDIFLTVVLQTCYLVGVLNKVA